MSPRSRSAATVPTVTLHHNYLHFPFDPSHHGLVATLFFTVLSVHSTT